MHPLLKKYPLITEQITKAEMAVVLRELEAVLPLDGDVVELGCFEGTSALFLQRVLVACAPDKKLHVYDSFAGLPPKHTADASPAGEQFKQGELHASRSHLIKNFKQASLPLPTIHACWFEQLGSADLPPRIAFAFLDGDFYTSIASSLRVIWPQLTPGATVVIDDYQTEALPGVRLAVTEWARMHRFKLQVEASLAILRPQ